MESPFPPFDPEGKSKNSAPPDPNSVRLRDIPLRSIVPNLLTLLAICSGLTAIRFAIEGRTELAVAAIIFAGFLDGIDGRVARFLKSTSRFGAEMDSLADFVNFGVAPALLLYFTLFSQLDSIGWIVALIYASCACLRLARFNVMLDSPKSKEWQKEFFIGVPAPAGALLVLLPVYLKLLGIVEDWLWSIPVLIYTLFCGFLMVSNLPTFSGKNVSQRVRRDLVLPILILAVFAAAALITYPWFMLSTIAICYLALLPFSYRFWQQRIRQTESKTK
ncbi:MAG: CDP-diacylglycerol--serine O-phosphatidyltransferase [Pseudomonadota bacterium]